MATIAPTTITAATMMAMIRGVLRRFFFGVEAGVSGRESRGASANGAGAATKIGSATGWSVGSDATIVSATGSGVSIGAAAAGASGLYTGLPQLEQNVASLVTELPHL